MCRHIVVLLQVLALVANPLLANATWADTPQSKLAGSGLASHEGVEDIRQHLPNYHRTGVETSMIRRSAIPTEASAVANDPSADGQIVCDPCCTVGTGYCAAIVHTLPEIPKPRCIRTSNITRCDFPNARQVAPQYHPPKIHA